MKQVVTLRAALRDLYRVPFFVIASACSRRTPMSSLSRYTTCIPEDDMFPNFFAIFRKDLRAIWVLPPCLF